MKNKNNLSASDFASVGDPNNPDTWDYPMSDEADTRLSLSKICAAPKDAQRRSEIADKLLKAAKSFGISDDDPIVQGVKDLVEKQLAAAESRRGKVMRKFQVARAASVTLNHQDKVQVAFDKMLGVKESGQRLYAERNGVEPLRMAGIPGFFSLREAYVFVTGDDELKFGFQSDKGFCSVSEATTFTSDFPNILLNSMTKKLIQDYAEVGMRGLDQIITEVDIADYKSQDRVRLGYLGDLSTVSEDAGYTDFSKMTDEKISYAATKRGNMLPLTRETILNDDLQKVASFPGRIARAARRTLKQFVTNFFINNNNYDVDSIAWFNAGHGNLGTAALTVDELISREAALFAQTEKDSGKPLGLSLDWIMVPGALKATAYKINTAENYNPAPNVLEPNPFYRRFGQNNERIIVNELLTDTNDWFYGTMPTEAPFIEVGYVQGVREPQIVLQDSDNLSGVAFTNDRVTYKVRHEYGGDILDFRGVGKNSVP